VVRFVVRTLAPQWTVEIILYREGAVDFVIISGFNSRVVVKLFGRSFDSGMNRTCKCSASYMDYGM